MIPRSLRARLLVAFLVVVAASLGTVGVAVLLVGPGYFAEAMGHVPGDPMGEAMSEATLAAFTDAIRQALVAATVIAVVTATVVSLAVAARIARPISALAAAARRLAGGHYAERVPVDEPGELRELATSFNDMAGSLEATERRRLQLVGDVAHELRTPLTTLDGYLEGLEDGVIEPSPETWRLLRAETGRLTRLVDGPVRAVACRGAPAPAADRGRGRRGRRRRGGRAVRAAGEVARHPDRCRRRAAAVASGDRDRVAQIIDNYLSNAIRHAPDGSAIARDDRRHDDRCHDLGRGPGTRAATGSAGGRLRAVLPGRSGPKPGGRRLGDRPRDRPGPRRGDGRASVGGERRARSRRDVPPGAAAPPATRLNARRSRLTES